MTPRALVLHWRTEADTLERYDARLASVARLHADELEASLRAVDDETLDLAAASKASGYSRDRLRHMLADGTIPNVGRKGSPRVRRADLPIKKRSSLPSSTFDANAIAGSILRANGDDSEKSA